VKQYFFLQLHSLAHGQDTRKQFQRQLVINRSSMPSNNFVCCSVKVMKAVMGIKDCSHYEYHVCARPACSGGGYVWDRIQRRDWKKHAADKCPHCQGPRFKTVATSGKEVLVPVSYYLDLGIDTVLEELFGNEEFCKLFAQASSMRESLTRDEMPGTFFMGKLKHALHFATDDRYDTGRIRDKHHQCTNVACIVAFVQAQRPSGY